MLPKLHRQQADSDLNAFLLWTNSVETAAKAFKELAVRFRRAADRNRDPQVRRWEIEITLAQHAGELLCTCWDTGMFQMYGGGEWDFRWILAEPSRIDAGFPYIATWCAFIRWYLAPLHPERFVDGWQATFFPEVDEFRPNQQAAPRRFQSLVGSAMSEGPEKTFWLADTNADVQEAACLILAEWLQGDLEQSHRRIAEFIAEGKETPKEEPEAQNTPTTGGDAGEIREALPTAASGPVDQRPQDAGDDGRPKRKRRRQSDAPPRPMTAKQAEAVQIVGECNGNISAAARRIGRTPATVRQHYEAGLVKLGKQAVKPGTQRLPQDKRGQENLSRDDDRRG